MLGTNAGYGRASVRACVRLSGRSCAHAPLPTLGSAAETWPGRRWQLARVTANAASLHDTLRDTHTPCFAAARFHGTATGHPRSERPAASHWHPAQMPGADAMRGRRSSIIHVLRAIASLEKGWVRRIRITGKSGTVARAYACDVSPQLMSTPSPAMPGGPRH